MNVSLGHGSLCISTADVVAIDKGCFDGIVLVHMLKADCLTDWRLVVNSLATVAVSACSYLVEEGAVHLVHLRAVNLGQAISHFSKL